MTSLRLFFFCLALGFAHLPAHSAAAHKAIAKPVAARSVPAKVAPKPTAPTASINAATAAVLRETSAVRGLKIMRPVPTAAISRPQIEAMLTREMNVQTTSRQVHGSELMLRVLGMVPNNFQLRPFYLKLLTEQVAGYYDPKARAFFTANWVDARAQKIVMLHELTHALQDQHFNLRRFQNWPRGDSDAQLAASALVEGDAMQAMVVYLQKRPLEAVGLLGASLQSSLGGTAELNNAPRSLRESLTFPYERGVQWVGQLYQRGGWAQVNRAFTQLPLSTEHILHIDAYLKREKPVEVRVPDIASLLGKGWNRVDEDVNGEWGNYLILDEFLKNDTESRRAAAGWGGDRYAVYEGPGGAACVVMLTAWDSKLDASEFFNAYTQRTTARATQQKLTVQNIKAGLKPNQRLARFGQQQTFIELRGNRVLVVEALPQTVSPQKVASLLFK
ncbi:MAG TPA: hypothetical protein VF600_00375 [Abditibacteriaceae bacterium]